MSDEQKPGDPADRAIDAKADGAFGGAASHRAGYGGIEFEGQTYTKLEWAERTARMGGTLAAGEGRMLLAEIDRLRARCREIDDEAFDYAEQIEQLKAEINRQRRILDALREPSEAVRIAVFFAVSTRAAINHVIHSALAAAEQEVDA